MNITRLVRMLKESDTKARIIHDFGTKFTQIYNPSSEVVWSGSVLDLEEDEVNFEIIPTLMGDL